MILETKGNYQPLRDVYFKFRFLCKQNKINWKKIPNNKIRLLREVNSKSVWTLYQANEIFTVINYFKGDLKNFGIIINESVIPKGEIPTATIKTNKVRRIESLTYNGSNFELFLNYSESKLKDIRAVGGCKFNKDKKSWDVGADNIDEVKSICDKYGIQISYSAKKIIEQYNGNFDQSYSSERVELNIPMKEGFNFFDYQTVGVSFGIRTKRPWITDQMGLGKAQPLDSLIYTPSGFTTMSDVKVGDEILDSKGQKQYVTGKFPQGQKDVYEVIFSDGSKTHCCKEHLWKVQTYNQRNWGNGKGFKVMPLEEIMTDYVYKNKNLKYSIPQCKPVVFNSKKTKIDPYFLGLILGDGCITSRINITSIDKEIIDYCSSYAVKLGLSLKQKKQNLIDYSVVGKKGVRNNLKQALIDYKLSGKSSKNKFIPYEYLYNDVETRLQILRGLMDTDGFCSKDGTCQYSSSSEIMANQVKWIVQSLGGVARKTKKSNLDHWIITININEKIFNLERKLDRVKNSKKYNPLRCIKQIRKVGTQDCCCISVSSEDRLYLTDEFVVTHNTVQAIGVAVGLNQYPILVICPKSLRYNWKKEVEQFTHRKSIIATKKVMSKIPDMVENNMVDFVIMNYDGVKTHFLKEMKKTPMKNGRVRKTVYTNGLEKYFKGVIIDESHELKNSKSDRFKVTKKVVQDMDIRVLLTGTPFVNEVKDIANQLDILGRVDEFGGVYRFCKDYAGITKNNFNSGEAKGRKHKSLKELNIKLRSVCMIRREKWQVLKDLPDKLRRVVRIELTNQKDYDHAYINLQSYLVSIGASEKKISASERANMLSQMQVLKKLSAKGKVEHISSEIKELHDNGEKVILFCWHLETINAYKKHFPHLVEISGNVEDNKIEINKENFQSNPDCNIIAITYKKGGVGHTLTAAAHVYFAELGWNTKDQDQAEDRAHRIGQTKNVTAHYGIGQSTIDEHIYAIIQRKRKLSEESLGSEEQIEISEEAELINLIQNKNHD